MAFLGRKSKSKKNKSIADSDVSLASSPQAADAMSKAEEESQVAVDQNKQLEVLWRDAKTAFGLGKVSIEMKEYPEARQNFKESLDIYSSIMTKYTDGEFEGDETEVEANQKKLRKKIADCRVELGDIAIVLGDYATAKMYFGEAQNVYELDNYVLEFNMVLKRTADIAFYEGEDEHAKEIYTNAVLVLEKEEYLGWAHSVIGKIYKSLAELHLDDEEWDECLKYYRNAASAMQNAEDIGKKHPDYAEVMYGHGLALVTLGDSLEASGEAASSLDQYKFAITPLKVSKEVYSELDREDLQDELASSNYYLGYCYAKLGKDIDAIQCFENEIKIIDKLKPDVRPSQEHVAQSLEYLGSLLLKVNPAKGVQVLKKALKINEKVEDIDQSVIFRLLHKLSRALAGDGKHEEALKCLEDALRIAKQINGKISFDYARYVYNL